jgi:dTMP kinase
MSIFISLEGGEGSGKTTQINRLASALMAEGYKVLTTREPGGTEEGEKIRNLLVQREGGNWNPIAEALMLFAARSMHIERIIKPALARGEVVILKPCKPSPLMTLHHH